ncbi:CsgG/HfaB family protein [Halomonas sp. YLGW01]|uniref:CsgG/HfaB family protein n=1 Tax=Halomonas sp. YLGW01 TaxID=2773308 RepID=UPI0017805A82|nr:CsgG/HfaB family protein [Halomonas sp. YLGW01]
MRILMISLLWLVLLPGMAMAGVETRTVHAEATGIDREDAIFNALGDAVRQVHGASVDASRELRTSMERTSTRQGMESQRSTTHRAKSESRTSVQSQGLISGYRVRSVVPASGGGMLARLAVDVPVYRVPGSASQSNRQRIAVYPVEASRSSYRLLGESIGAGQVSRRLTQSIVQALVQSRRFSVLDRDMRAAIDAEKRFVAHGDVPLREKAMLGNSLGADYLVVTRLTEMNLDWREVRSQITGERSQEPVGTASLEARVVVPATGQVMWSETLSVSLEDLGLEGERQAGVQPILDGLGNELTFRALNVIYPLRVVESRERQVVLNQGGTLLKVGQRWQVFDIGKDYTDPYHGESLGPRESWTADVEIIRVADKVAYAKVIDGEVEGNGQVLRRPQNAAAAREAEFEQIRGTRERVCLPIDPC